MDAVIFDLFGTLVPNLSPTLWQRAYAEIAEALGLEAADFERVWKGFFDGRMRGAYGDVEEQLSAVVQAVGMGKRAAGLALQAERLMRAAEVKRRFMLISLAPKPEAVACLEALRARGLKLALATDCSWETPDLLDRTPLGEFFPVRAASARLGARKPDPRMYRHVLDGLHATGERCLYVGDGNSEELPGAKRHGMTTVWVDNGAQQHWKDGWVPEADHTIRDLLEILQILEK